MHERKTVTESNCDNDKKPCFVSVETSKMCENSPFDKTEAFIS